MSGFSTPAEFELLQIGGLRSGADRPQQTRDGQRRFRPHLAGKAHVGRRGNARERDGFGVSRRVQRRVASIDAHAAGRAARAPTAHRSVRDAIHAADLEQRRAEGHPHGRPAGVLDRHLRPRALHVPAPADVGRNEQQEGAESQTHQQPVPRQQTPVGGVGPVGQLLDAGEHLGALDRLGNGAARDHESAQRRQRDGDGDKQQQRLEGAIGRIEAQPEMDADAAVRPHQQQQRALQDRALRPQPRQLVEVIVLDVEKHVRDARVDDVREQQERDGEAEDELHQLPRRQPKGVAVGELVERQRDVRRQRHHQHERARQRARHHLPPRLHVVHGLQMDEPHRGVEEMRGGEREQNETRGDPEPLRELAPEQDVHVLWNAWVHHHHHHKRGRRQ